MTIKEQVILKTLINSIKFSDFKPKLTISKMKNNILGMESYQVTIYDNNKNNKTKPVVYIVTVSYYNEQVPEATDLFLYSILFD